MPDAPSKCNDEQMDTHNQDSNSLKKSPKETTSAVVCNRSTRTALSLQRYIRKKPTQVAKKLTTSGNPSLITHGLIVVNSNESPSETPDSLTVKTETKAQTKDLPSNGEKVSNDVDQLKESDDNVSNISSSEKIINSILDVSNIKTTVETVVENSHSDDLSPKMPKKKIKLDNSAERPKPTRKSLRTTPSKNIGLITSFVKIVVPKVDSTYDESQSDKSSIGETSNKSMAELDKSTDNAVSTPVNKAEQATELTPKSLARELERKRKEEEKNNKVAEKVQHKKDEKNKKEQERLRLKKEKEEEIKKLREEKEQLREERNKKKQEEIE